MNAFSPNYKMNEEEKCYPNVATLPKGEEKYVKCWCGCHILKINATYYYNDIIQLTQWYEGKGHRAGIRGRLTMAFNLLFRPQEAVLDEFWLEIKQARKMIKGLQLAIKIKQKKKR